MTAGGPELYRDVRAAVERYLELTHPWHAAVIAVYVFQTHLVASLVSVFYVGFIGPKGSGKTTALQVASELSRDGLMTGNASVAALARTMDEGVSLFIDELDELKGDVLELTQSALRQGYRRGSVYLRWDAKGNRSERVRTFGPKMVSFRTGVEDALASRMYPIPMSPAADVERALDNMTRDLSGLRGRLAEWAKAALAEWPHERVSALVQEPAFREGVRRLIGPAGSPREVEIAAVMLAVSAVVGVDILAEIGGAVQGQRDAAFDDELSELSDFVRSEWSGLGKPPAVETEVLRTRWNDLRKSLKEPLRSQYRFRAMLREIGFRDGVTLIRRTAGRDGKGRSAVDVGKWASMSLTPDTGSLTEFQKSFTAPLQVPHHGEGVEGLVRELLLVVRDRLNTHVVGEGLPGKSFTAKDAESWASAAGLDASRVEGVLRRWAEQGVVYQPVYGRWKLA